jgi:hypothetical protein
MIMIGLFGFAADQVDRLDLPAAQEWVQSCTLCSQKAQRLDAPQRDVFGHTRLGVGDHHLPDFIKSTKKDGKCPLFLCDHYCVRERAWP